MWIRIMLTDIYSFETNRLKGSREGRIFFLLIGLLPYILRQTKLGVNQTDVIKWCYFNAGLCVQVHR